MNVGCQVSEKCAACLATARSAPGSADLPGQDFLDRATAHFRSNIAFQVPVGFEAEDGFHCGEPWLLENCRVAPALEYMTNANSF
jgi:hypothetical protein